WDRRTAAATGDLRDRATEVHVDVIDEALADEALDGLAHVEGIDAVELEAARRFVGAKAGQPCGLAIALDQRPRGDHLTHEQARDRVQITADALEPLVRKPATQRAKRVIGDPGHRREHDRGPQPEGP